MPKSEQKRGLFFNNQRRTKIVDVAVQARLAVEIFLHIFVFLSLLVLIIYEYPFATLFSPYPLTQHQEALEFLVTLNLPKWPLFVGLIVFVVMISILFSHRIAGPYYRIKKTLQDYAQKNFREVFILRKHDYFHPIISVMNDLRSVVHKDKVTLEEQLHKLQENVNRISGQENQQTKLEMEVCIRQLIEQIQSYSVD